MAKIAAPGGRPRQSGIVTDDPREGILTVAAELFADKGFNETRMTEVAEAAGLRQSSIYYWFRSKDEILRAIMDQNRVSLTAARALSYVEESAAVRLYIILYQDVIQMCSAPLNFYGLEEAAKKQPETFSDFHADYDELYHRMETVVQDGITSEVFCEISAPEFVRTALSLNEGSQYRFHVDGRRREEMHDYADSAAWMALRSVLRDAQDLDTIRARAREGIQGFRALAPVPLS